MADMAVVVARGYRSITASSSEDMRAFEAAKTAFLEVKPHLRSKDEHVEATVAGLLWFCCVSEPRLLWPL